MTLADIGVFIIIAVVYAFLVRGKWRIHILFGISVIAIFSLQPVLPIRGMDFWLPIVTLALVVFSWILTASIEQRSWRSNWRTAVILGSIVLALGLTRYLGFSLPLTASRPPQILQIGLSLGIIFLIAAFLGRFNSPNRLWLVIGSLVIIGFFLILKIPAMAKWASLGLRSFNGQAAQMASASDLSWLGFSYIAFRLLHTFRDRQTARLPSVSLSEYIVYVLFFPALTAGPIDRIERFITDLRQPSELSVTDWTAAGQRLVIGLFKKFVIADSLALIALNPANALQVRTAGWTWVMLYAYSFQIFLDFSGYTDIAIGLGRMLGIKLPENFNAPYLKANLTQFWNSWHMTLTQWFRSYFFNPFTRALRSLKRPLPIPLVIFISQIATMLLIGFWHGVTVNFILWGLWHGLGLFIHNRWSELTRSRFNALPTVGQRVLNLGGTLLTFNFVSLGWVFFTLPLPTVSWHIFMKLFGVA